MSKRANSQFIRWVPRYAPFSAMFERFLVFLRELGISPLEGEGPTFVVGYSGGADSTCLLHLLHRAEVDVIAAHLHHGMRDEADKEMALCEAFCEELDVPFASGKADVPQIAATHKIGIEEAGRRARQDFLRRVAAQTGATAIATAHTRDDHLETMLFNMARGTGLAGLAGIPATHENKVRPLINFTREETRAYSAEHGLWFHDDPANSDLQFSRARIRHRVVPELRLAHPGFDQSMVRLAATAEAEDSYLNSVAGAALEHCEASLNGNLHFLTRDCEFALNTAQFQALHPVIARRAIRLLAAYFGADLGYDNTQKVLTENQGAVTLEGGEAVIEWSESLIHVRQLSPITPFRYPLTVPGETDSPEFGWVLAASRTQPIDYQREPGALDAKLDPRKLKGALYFRTAEAKDELARVGTGPTSLSKLMQDKSLTPAARQRLPVICDLIGPVWVPGIGLSDRVKITESTTDALWLRFGPLSGHNG